MDDDNNSQDRNDSADDNNNSKDRSSATCPGTWLIAVVLLITAAAIAVAAFAVYQWRQCAQADAQAAISVAVSPVDEYARGMRAMGLTPTF